MRGDYVFMYCHRYSAVCVYSCVYYQSMNNVKYLYPFLVVGCDYTNYLTNKTCLCIVEIVCQSTHFIIYDDVVDDMIE